MFPSLINCCTIDWFESWPTEALQTVAESFTEQIELEVSVWYLVVLDLCEFVCAVASRDTCDAVSVCFFLATT